MTLGSAPDLAFLLDLARHHKMTPAEQEEQRRGFAYGNANIENPSVTRQMIDEQAELLRLVDFTWT